MADKDNAAGGRRILDSRFSILDAGCWMLDCSSPSGLTSIFQGVGGRIQYRVSLLSKTGQT
jgi:hypothetical protein